MSHHEELISFVQQKGFVWGPEPELYGGLSGFFTYAPLGKLLKNNVEQQIRKVFTSNNFWEVECPTIMPAAVWKASGHLGGFTDYMLTTTDGKIAYKVEGVDAATPQEELQELARKEKLIFPKHSKLIVKKHNLMMPTTIGLNTEAYNRPETATTTYLPFIRYYDYFRKKVPFAVFQIGKAYRNEINPRQHIIRMREFTQAEAQLFLTPAQKKAYKLGKTKSKLLPLQHHAEKEPTMMAIKDALKKKYFQSPAYAWTVALAYDVFISMGIPAEHIRLRQHAPDERAFYALDAWDLEVKTHSFGWVEMCGIHDRGDYDLKQHGKHAKKSLVVLDDNEEKIVPHVLEIAFGVDRPVFGLLDIFYDKKDKDEGKTIFKIPPQLAPVTAAIFPLVKKDNLPKIAEKLYKKLLKDYVVKYDQSGSIGKRYLREQEAGTPLCITIDFDTVEKKTVTIRERDTEQQIRVPLTKVKKVIDTYLAGKEFTSLGEKV